ncbi:unnamed protein product, partial [Musa acuminata var. zebrina]
LWTQLWVCSFCLLFMSYLHVLDRAFSVSSKKTRLDKRGCTGFKDLYGQTSIVMELQTG